MKPKDRGHHLLIGCAHGKRDAAGHRVARGRIQTIEGPVGSTDRLAVFVGCRRRGRDVWRRGARCHDAGAEDQGESATSFQFFTIGPHATRSYFAVFDT